jgi:hypothetical protein
MDLRSLPPTDVISGFPFVATSDEVAAMDMLVGPTRPMMPGKRGGRRVMVRDCVIPYRWQVWFLDAIVSSFSADLRMELVRSDGAMALYRFPPKIVDALSALTPGQPAFTKTELDSMTDKVMPHPDVQRQYQRGGVFAALLFIRCDALKAVPRNSGKEVYYWCYRTTEAHRLRDLDTFGEFFG